MAVQLKKGQRINLTQSRTGLHKLSFQVEWETGQQGSNQQDLDISAIRLGKDGKIRGEEDFVSTNTPRSRNSSVVYVGGGRTPRGRGKHVRVNLPRVMGAIEKVIFILSLDESQHQPAGWPSGIYFSISDDETGELLACYVPVDGNNEKRAVVVGELYRHKQEWKFHLIDQFSTLTSLCRLYGLEGHEPPPVPPLKDSDPLSLQRGEKVLLDTGTGAGKILAEIGWDRQKDSARRDFELKTAAFLLRTGDQVGSAGDFVFQDNPRDETGSVSHHTQINGPDQLGIDLAGLPGSVSKIALTLVIHEGFARHQSFDRITGLYLRFLCESSGREIIRFEPGDVFRDETATIFGIIYRYQQKWKFHAVCTPLSGGLASLCRRYGLKLRKLGPEPRMGFRRLDRQETNLRFVAKRDLEQTGQMIREHFRCHIDNTGWGVFEYRSDPAPLDIYIIEPAPSRDYYTLVTHGISNLLPADSGFATELMFCLPPEWPLSERDMQRKQCSWPITLLRELAARVVHKNRTLVPGTIIPNSKGSAVPYAENTRFCGVLVYVPVLFAEFEDLAVSDRKKIHFLSLFPLYREEMVFAAEQGSDLLFERLSRAGITELLRVDRENMVREEKPRRRSSWFGFNRS